MGIIGLFFFQHGPIILSLCDAQTAQSGAIEGACPGRIFLQADIVSRFHFREGQKPSLDSGDDLPLAPYGPANGRLRQRICREFLTDRAYNIDWPCFRIFDQRGTWLNMPPGLLALGSGG